MKGYVLWTDGSLRGKIGGGGAVLNHKKQSIMKLSKFFNERGLSMDLDSNDTEWLALMYGLREMVSHNYILGINKKDYITVFTDSNMVYQQMNGEWQTNTDLQLFCYNECWRLLYDLFDKHNIVISWISREMNGEADKLAKSSTTRKTTMLTVRGMNYET